MIENFSVWDLKKNGAGGCIGYRKTFLRWKNERE